jgi:pilus assembly protein CpaB
MRRARLIVMAIAIFAALAAGLLAYGMMGRPAQRQQAAVKVDTVKVLVATKAIGFGDEVRASDFTWASWPKEMVAEGKYITDANNPDAIKQFTGSVAAAPFLPKEPIRENKLRKLGSGGVLAAILTSGMRAASTKITEETSAGSFILPNDRVDVIVTRKQRSANGRGDQQVSETLFRNIRVLAIGQDLDQKDGKKVAAGKTATLELTPSQSETLALNNSIGEVSLALRSLEDAIKSKNGMAEEDTPKKDRPTGIKVLRYGNWSRTYGLN